MDHHQILVHGGGPALGGREFGDVPPHQDVLLEVPVEREAARPLPRAAAALADPVAHEVLERLPGIVGRECRGIPRGEDEQHADDRKNET